MPYKEEVGKLERDTDIKNEEKLIVWGLNQDNWALYKEFWHKALFLALTLPASLMSELLLFHWLSEMRAPAAKGLLNFREAADESVAESKEFQLLFTLRPPIQTAHTAWASA